jgi:hypothetical protein
MCVKNRKELLVFLCFYGLGALSLVFILTGIIPIEGIRSILSAYLATNAAILAIIFAVVALNPISQQREAIFKQINDLESKISEDPTKDAQSWENKTIVRLYQNLRKIDNTSFTILVGTYVTAFTILFCLWTYFLAYIQPAPIATMASNFIVLGGTCGNIFYNSTSLAYAYAGSLSPIVNNLTLVISWLFFISTFLTIMVIWILLVIVRDILKP